MSQFLESGLADKESCYDDWSKDRLAGFYHWNDKQALEQAINICLEQSIDLSEVKDSLCKRDNWKNLNFLCHSLRNAKKR